MERFKASFGKSGGKISISMGGEKLAGACGYRWTDEIPAFTGMTGRPSPA
jgi:hypothetical protein